MMANKKTCSITFTVDGDILKNMDLVHKKLGLSKTFQMERLMSVWMKEREQDYFDLMASMAIEQANKKIEFIKSHMSKERKNDK